MSLLAHLYRRYHPYPRVPAHRRAHRVVLLVYEADEGAVCVEGRAVVLGRGVIVDVVVFEEEEERESGVAAGVAEAVERDEYGDAYQAVVEIRV